MIKDTKPTNINPRLGRPLDDLLAERGMLEEVRIAAIKRVISIIISDEKRRRHITISEMNKENKQRNETKVTHLLYKVACPL